MVLSAAEKQAAYRKRLNGDAEKRRLYLEKKRTSYAKSKADGKVKLVKDLSLRDARYQRKKWKDRQQLCRKRKKDVVDIITPPGTPDLEEEVPIPLVSSSQKKHGRKLVRRDRAKCYKDNNKLRDKLKQVTADRDKYKKRLQRLQVKTKSPRSAVNKELKLLKINVPPSVKRTLIFHKTVLHKISAEYNATKKQKVRRTCEKLILCSKLLKRYRLMDNVKKDLPFSKRALRRINESQTQAIESHFKLKAKELRKLVTKFFERDDISRMTNGKKLTITRFKVKKQKRLLNDYMCNLHKKFLSEYPHMKLSYSQFTRIRPFWIVTPSEKDRDTCMCKTCENIRLMLMKLQLLRVTAVKSPMDIPVQITCGHSKNCYYGVCPNCKDKEIDLVTLDPNKEVSVMQWVTGKVAMEKVNVDGTIKKYQVQKTSKENKIMMYFDLKQAFNLAAKRYCKHIYNIKHQYRELRSLRIKLVNNECIIHIDFSENYTLKYSNQVQSAHFGASSQQATIHTGVLYVPGNKSEPISFGTISNSLQHGPGAVWSHLHPILDLVRQKYENIDFVHFYSDGPCSQYRQKGNFYLFSTQLFNMGFKGGTWNFFESGHGRGAPDGVGGVLKRRADDLVQHGMDLPSAESLFQALVKSGTPIKLFYISDETIVQSINDIPNTLTAVPKTMTIHQVTTNSPFQISYRDVSCFCDHGGCKCFKPNIYIFPNCLNDEIPVSEPENITADIEPENITENTGTNHNTVFSHITPIETKEDIVGKWVVLNYDGSPYPGIVQSVTETDIVVKSMHSSPSAKNKFFWPRMNDILPYDFDDIITVMSEPNVLSTGHIQIPPLLWQEICIKLNL